MRSEVMKRSVALCLVISNTITALLCYFMLFHLCEVQDGFLQEECEFTELEISKSFGTTPQGGLYDNSYSEVEWNQLYLNRSSDDSQKKLIYCSQRDPVNSTVKLVSYPSTTVIGITPTHKRLTQKSDLTSLCHTIMHVPNFLWLIIEDSSDRSSLVANILMHCKVKSVHLNALTSSQSKRAKQRGVEQRNAGLNWIRKYCTGKCNGLCDGVVYFMDDDNKYDLRLFQEIRSTKSISVFPVGYSGGLLFEGPICKDGRAVEWQAVWQSKERHIPVDMAAFAIHVSIFVQKPLVKVGYRPGRKNRRSKSGFMESDLISNLGKTRDEVECKGLQNEVLVWHVKTTKPLVTYKNKYPDVEV